MKTNSTGSLLKVGGLLALASVFGATVLVACSDSENPTPVDAGAIDGGIIVVEAGPPKDGPTTGDTLIPDAGGGANGDVLGGYTGPNGCWQGPASTSAQALNACTTGSCTPFNNAVRLPLYDNGNLPAVP